MSIAQVPYRRAVKRDTKNVKLNKFWTILSKRNRAA